MSDTPVLPEPILALTMTSAIEEYVSTTPFKCVGPPVPLSGGGVNFCWRLHLETPYDGKSTAVLKHAESYVKIFEEMPVARSRIRYEKEALEVLAAAPFLQGDLSSHADDPRPIARVPKVYCYDEASYILIVEDAGESVTLKEFVSSGRATSALATQIGTELGTFLASMHAYGRGNELLRERFTDSPARDICTKRTPGRLLEHAEKFGGVVPGGREYERLGEIVKMMSEETMESEETLIMGDFWTGNILVSLTPAGALQSLYIIDWEFVRYGPAPSDVGQFSAEAWLLARYRAPSGLPLLEAFYAAYQRGYPGVGAKTIADGAIYADSHVVVWAPVLGWAEEGPMRQTVAEHLEHVSEAWDARTNGAPFQPHVSLTRE